MKDKPLTATVTAALPRTEPITAAVDPGELFALPETGEALLTTKQLASALGIGETSVWAWVKSDPDFPKPVRRGLKFTRFKLTETRAYIAGLTAGTPKPSPAQRAKVVRDV